ncbi:MAG: hypothetical protein EMLJLAPB_00656 [Candidatus Argoarchaeum ethanivorans]|uniref:Uncharacterized protein n=1 Tax=Candidatus Argoarchaeum ethanivorans TaxID=2608793 RepID=A0A811T9G0_9EURY|nr:MAG: hypothetical protein EMLJLAPB_00656 [Candidatus Argoarchaeum ethanivorans]
MLPILRFAGEKSIKPVLICVLKIQRKLYSSGKSLFVSFLTTHLLRTELKEASIEQKRPIKLETETLKPNLTTSK